MIRQLCIILDQDYNSNTKQLYHDYKLFKCNGFNKWYETLGVFPWAIPSYDPDYDDINTSNKYNLNLKIRKIRLYVTTIKDPYVWALYFGTLHFSNLNVNKIIDKLIEKLWNDSYLVNSICDINEFCSDCIVF